MNLFFARIFPAIFLLAGAGIMFAGVRDLVRASASDGWPIVRGVVESARVDSETDSDSGTTYSAEIVYRYTVEGVEHLGNRVRFGEISTGDPNDAQQVVNRYPPATDVAVYYDRSAPDIAVLEPGVHLSTWFLPGFGSVFFAAGLGMAIFLPRAMRKQAARKADGEVLS